MCGGGESFAVYKLAFSFFFLLLATLLQTLNDIVLRFNDTSTLVGHFVSSPREREKRDRRAS